MRKCRAVATASTTMALTAGDEDDEDDEDDGEADEDEEDEEDSEAAVEEDDKDAVELVLTVAAVAAAAAEAAGADAVANAGELDRGEGAVDGARDNAEEGIEDADADTELDKGADTKEASGSMDAREGEEVRGENDSKSKQETKNSFEIHVTHARFAVCMRCSFETSSHWKVLLSESPLNTHSYRAHAIFSVCEKS
jgi:hypothetical protein